MTLLIVHGGSSALTVSLELLASYKLDPDSFSRSLSETMEVITLYPDPDVVRISFLELSSRGDFGG